jgi:signal peptidase I
VARKGTALLREYSRAVLGAVLVALVLRGFVAEPFRVPSGSMVPTLVAGDVIVVNKLAYGPRIPFTMRRILHLGAPARGDVIVFSNPREPRKDVVRRVVGLPGDVVEIRDGTVWVNGVPQPRTAAGQLTYEELNESTGRWWSDTCLLFSEKLAQGAIPPPQGNGEGALEARWAAGAARGLATHGVLQCRRARPLPPEGPFQTVAPGHVFVLGDNRDRCADSRSEGGWQVPFENIAGKAMLVGWSWGRGGTFSPRGAGVRIDRLFKRIE